MGSLRSAAPAPPTTGTHWHIGVSGPKLDFAVLALAKREAHVPLGPLGTFGLDPATAVTWPGLIPIGSRRIGMVEAPASSGLPSGAKIHVQTLVADPVNLHAPYLTSVWDDAVR